MTTDGQTSTDGVELSGADLDVRADADKLFFIDMLVKDIELIPAILDLVDNSVDSARSLAIMRHDLAASDAGVDLAKDAYAGLKIEVSVDPDKFRISDNCAGISIDTARRYAFRFGRAKKFEGVSGSVGEFGVGMKRALFKLGREFAVRSRSSTERFDLFVDVDDWLAEDDDSDWTFRFKTAATSLPEADEEDRGTEISVRRLHTNVQDDFADDLVIGLLREQLRLRHHIAMEAGLSLWLNGEPLRGLRPELMSGPNFQPIRRTFSLELEQGTVFIELIAGVVKSDRKDLIRDDGNAENFRGTSEAGWWVFCNNRLLLVADKTPTTGWGNPGAAYHPQYRLFRGYVYLSSLESNLLPWNTTKTGIDLDSRVWRKIQGQLGAALSEVQGLINRLKNEREDLGSESAAPGDDQPYTRAISNAHSTPIRLLPKSSTLVVPPIPSKPRQTRRKSMQRLQFDVPKPQYERAMEVLELSTAAELGRTSFDYLYEREVGEQ